MIKNIPLTTLATNPPALNAADGQLSTAANVLCEDGALHIINSNGAPALFEFAVNHSLAFIHHTATGQTNYIILSVNTNMSVLRWCREQSGYSLAVTAVIPDFSFSTLHDITAIGNTLCVATDLGLNFILFKDNSYVNLGNRPAFIPLEFGVVTDAISESYKIEATGADKTTIERTELKAVGNYTGDDYIYDGNSLEIVNNAVLGCILDAAADKITKKGMFWQSFFIRYAFRLADGSYAWHSTPIFIPLSLNPPKVYWSKSTTDNDSLTIEGATSLVCASIYFRLMNSVTAATIKEQLALWGDIVKGIDVFVSAPIYNFKQGSPVIGLSRGYQDILKQYSIYTEDELTIGENNYISCFTGLSGSIHTAGENTYYNCYPNTVTFSPESTYHWILTPNDQFRQEIKDVSAFYLVASYTIDEILAATEMTQLNIADKDLSALVTRATLSDDNNTHRRYLPNRLYSYNSRLHMFNTEVKPMLPLPISASVCYYNSTTEDNNSSIVQNILAFTRINGIRAYSGASHNLDTLHLNDATSFPRYIFFPDANATHLRIVINGTTYTLPLTQHDFLNGAYWFGGFGPDPWANISTDDSSINPDDYATSIKDATNMYISDVDYPILVKSSFSLGGGRIIGIASAAKALSQGQFGQYPLYGFTADGIWALTPKDDGTYTSSQPMARDVCTNADSITQLDGAVLFVTSRGLMMVEGSNVSCLSKLFDYGIAGDANLPSVERLHGFAFAGEPMDYLSPTSFIDFLQSAQIGYDYKYQRLFITHKDSTYAYVLSLRSQCWGTVCMDANYLFNAYPDGYVVRPYTTSDGQHSRLYKLSEFSDMGSALIITRPLKLNDADALKTINQLDVRGDFSKGNVNTVLYGCRDINSGKWHIVSSSVIHQMRNLIGSPYRVFRVAIVANLIAPGKSISDINVQFTTPFQR